MFSSVRLFFGRKLALASLAFHGLSVVVPRPKVCFGLCVRRFRVFFRVGTSGPFLRQSKYFVLGCLYFRGLGSILGNAGVPFWAVHRGSHRCDFDSVPQGRGRRTRLRGHDRIRLVTRSGVRSRHRMERASYMRSSYANGNYGTVVRGTSFFVVRRVKGRDDDYGGSGRGPGAEDRGNLRSTGRWFR